MNVYRGDSKQYEKGQQQDRKPFQKGVGGGQGRGFQRGGGKQEFEKDGITFAKSKPTFKKSEHVGNKADFPELGDDFAKKQASQPEPKASAGGAIGQMSAPAKSGNNKFEGLQHPR
jgi:hypothetical protein